VCLLGKSLYERLELIERCHLVSVHKKSHPKVALLVELLLRAVENHLLTGCH
jgi:hypothetical protein